MKRTLASLLENSFSQFGEKIALRADDQSICYNTLWAWSDSFIAVMENISNKARIVLHLEKNPLSIAAILACVRLGYAYIPLHPKTPIERKKIILQEVAPGLILTSSAENMNWPTDIPLLATESISLQQKPLYDFQKNSSLSEKNLAYILFTSGSTGIPKGVAVSHGAAYSFAHWAQNYFQLHTADCLASVAALHFDLSIFDIFAGLASGATISLIPAHLLNFPLQLAPLIHKEKISVWYSVPSALAMLAENESLVEKYCQSLQKILFAGDVIPMSTLQSLQKNLAHTQFFNLYGPTETNVCTVYPVPRPLPEKISIGQACCGDTIFLLKEDGSQASANELGEILVCGPTLFDSYFGNESGTKNSFLTEPELSAEKLYRTGDLAHRDEQGLLFLHGRKDTQVKVAGFRIELEEIESILNRHEGVQQAAVSTTPSPHRGKQLRAYIQRKRDTASFVTEDELLQYLSQYLPNYVIPQEWFFIETLPLTANGKLDRTQLGSL